VAGAPAWDRLLSDQEPPVSRWLVRKSDGTELRFPSLEALKSYILSGVVTSGDVVAPEGASWARVEDLAELASLMGMIAPPSDGASAAPRRARRYTRRHDDVLDNDATRPPTSNLQMSAEEASLMTSSPTTKPPPLPEDEQELSFEDDTEARTLYSGPPSFEPDAVNRQPSLRSNRAEEVAPLSRPIITAPRIDEENTNPLSRPLQTTTALEDELLSGPFDDRGEHDLLSRPVSRVDSDPQTHEIMTLNMRRAQRRKILLGSSLLGMLVAAAIFFAVRSIQEASTPPDQSLDQAKKSAPPDTTPPSPAAEATEAKAPKQNAQAAAHTQDNPQADDPGDSPAVNNPAKPPENAKAPEKIKAAENAKAPEKTKAGPPKVSSKPRVAAAAKSSGEKPSKEGPRNSQRESATATPANVDGLMARAKKLRKKNPGEALRLYLAVLKRNPSHGDAMQLAARAYLQLGRTGDAIKLLKTCQNKRPRFSPCLYYLGRSLERAGQGAEAKKAYRKLIDEFPESSLSIKARTKLGG
jgi:tetratricopeptide (TPR) repeat protein